MKYTIKPYIQCLDEQYSLFLTEIHQLKNSELQDIIDSCNAAINGENIELYWGWDISSLDIKKEVTLLSYNNTFQAEIPTTEIYTMLTIYLDKLKEYENGDF